MEGGLSNVETTLNSVDTQLAAAQAQAAQLKQTIPVAITVAMIVLTLFMASVAYTQIVVMRGAWRKLRAPGASPEVVLLSAEASG